MKMKIFIVGIVLFSLFSFAKAQTYESTTYLDMDLNACKKSKAVYIGKCLHEDGLFRVDCYTMAGDLLIRSIHYTDETMQTRQGIFHAYFRDSKIYKEGHYSNGVKNGIWKRWSATGELIDSSVYTNGKNDFSSQWFYIKHRLMAHAVTDSLLDTYVSTDYDSTGRTELELKYAGEHGSMKFYDSTGIETDTLFTRKDDKLAFKKEHKEWKHYLQKNLNGIVPIDNNAPAGVYEVMVNFMIMKDGTIANVEAETNFGYGMEKEAVMVIAKGANWNPPTVFGHPINALHAQPVTFDVENQ